MIMQIFTPYYYAWRNVIKILNLLFDTFYYAKLFFAKISLCNLSFFIGNCTYPNGMKFVQ